MCCDHWFCTDCYGQYIATELELRLARGEQPPGLPQDPALARLLPDAFTADAANPVIRSGDLARRTPLTPA